jgi:hypothetical protein
MQTNCESSKPKMNIFFPLLTTLFALALPLYSQESASTPVDEADFVYHVGEVNYLTGEGVNMGGFLLPSLYVNATAGGFDGGFGAEDFATSEHDPQNDVSIQGIELHLDLNFNEVVTGMVRGIGHQGHDEVWEAALEEADLHWNVTDVLAIGGGQFLNTFGFQGDRHLHEWLFVNQNLVNSRLLNEGELVTQGGEILVKTPSSGLLTLSFGGVRTHAHEEEDDGGIPDPDHVHADEAGFNDWVFNADYRFRLPVDDSVTVLASLAHGENGFGLDSSVYGFGFRKTWNGHDHGNGGPDFCGGALMLQSEFIGRGVDAFNEGGDAVDFSDRGASTALHYGLTDRTTVSLRHDWVSAVEVAELSDRNRLSAALTAFVDPEQRVRARIQYDHVQDATIGIENAVWFQLQFQWGGVGGSHVGHGH